MSDHLIAKELRAAAEARSDAEALFRQLSELCAAGKWPEAEGLRQQVLMLTEASLDAYIRAARALEKMRHGEAD